MMNEMDSDLTHYLRRYWSRERDIARYLRNEMDEDELDRMEIALLEDSDLRAEVMLVEALGEGFNQMSDNELSSFKVEQSYGSDNVTRPSISVGFKNWYSYGIAAALLIMIILPSLYFSNSVNESDLPRGYSVQGQFPVISFSNYRSGVSRGQEAMVVSFSDELPVVGLQFDVYTEDEVFLGNKYDLLISLSKKPSVSMRYSGIAASRIGQINFLLSSDNFQEGSYILQLTSAMDKQLIMKRELEVKKL